MRLDNALASILPQPIHTARKLKLAVAFSPGEFPPPRNDDRLERFRNTEVHGAIVENQRSIVIGGEGGSGGAGGEIGGGVMGPLSKCPGLHALRSC